MSNGVISSVTKSIVAVGLFVGTLAGCGSSGSGSSLAASCMKGCTTAVACLADAGLGGVETVSSCVQTCEANAKPANGGTCTNEADLEKAAANCASMTDCTTLNACIQALPKCQSTGGNGGTSGGATGGTSGGATGGTSGTSGGATGGTSGGATGGTSGGAAGTSGTAADCSMCDKANSCCMALATLESQPPSSCTLSTSACNGLTGTAQSSYAMECSLALSTGKQLSISACQ